MLPTCQLLAKIQMHGALSLSPKKYWTEYEELDPIPVQEYPFRKKSSAPISLAHGREILAFGDGHPAAPKGLTKLKELNQIPVVFTWDIP